MNLLKRKINHLNQYFCKIAMATCCGALFATAPLLAAAQEKTGAYPERPIRILLPFAAGGSTDGPMRVLAKQVSESLRQPVVIDYRPGAGGTLAVQTVHSAKPDGYTLAVAVASVYRMPYTMKVNWNPATDLTYIIGITGYAFGIVVPAASPFTSLDDLIAHAKAHPGKLTYSTPGVATTNHLTMEKVSRQVGIKLNHIPYKGSGESLQALLAGQVDAAAETSAFVPLIQAGKLRLLAVWGDKRMARFPDVPTLKETGIDMVQTSPWGLVAPKGTDPAIVRKLHDAFKVALETEEFKTILAQFDMTPEYKRSDEFQQFATASMDKEKKIIEELGLKLAQ
ncbi:MAG TPA: tripartite tricarboxylate transporter substrate binding protein [Advenella sp.]|nr:tripartite tricarboxylate transporter substrate binding protein [Advenella sp.]